MVYERDPRILCLDGSHRSVGIVEGEVKDRTKVQAMVMVSGIVAFCVVDTIITCLYTKIKSSSNRSIESLCFSFGVRDLSGERVARQAPRSGDFFVSRESSRSYSQRLLDSWHIQRLPLVIHSPFSTPLSMYVYLRIVCYE